MKINREARNMAKKLYNSCLVGGLIDEDRTKKTVAYLVEKKPRNYFPILNRMKKLISLKLAESAAVVESAAPLGAEEQVLSGKIRERFGSHVKIRFVQKPELLGGLRITVGSQVWDGSIRYRLNTLENSF
ncbi:MAG: F0F1 ATP synthase subunit delta [Blastochloris sp.]|nr:F0F1 ATP synthase subunit delta [Blastochloris sp.]